MKRAIIVLASLLMLIPVCASALGLGPEAAVTALNNLVDAAPIEGVTQVFAYNEESNTVILGVVSEAFMDAAVEAAKAGETNSDWTAAKSYATQMYDTARELITLYDKAETGMQVFYMTSVDSDGTVYYAIGDEDASECHVILDAITNDTEITPYEEEEKE